MKTGHVSLNALVLKILLAASVLVFASSVYRPTLELASSAIKIHINKQPASIVLGNSYYYAGKYSDENTVRGNILMQGYSPWLFVYYVYPKAVYYSEAVPEKNRIAWLRQRHIYSVVNSKLVK